MYPTIQTCMKKIYPIFILLFLMAGMLPAASMASRSGDGKEYLWLDTDRDIYIAGENLFFSLQLFAEGGSADDPSNFVYLTLRGKHGLVKGISKKLRKSSGGGRIYLPDTLSTGYYELIAYTSWMRNQGPESYALRDILVINRFDRDLEGLISSGFERTGAARTEKTTPAKDGQADVVPPGPKEPAGEAAIHSYQNLPARYGPLTARIDVGENFGKRDQVRLHVFSPDQADPIASLQVSVSRQETLYHMQVPGQNNHPPAGDLRMPSDAFPMPRESAHMTLTGRVVHTWTGEGVPDVRVLLNTPDTLLTMIYTRTGPQGHFVFYLGDYHDDKVLYLIVDPATTDQPVTIDVHDKYSLEFPFTERPFAGIPGRKDFIMELQEMVRISKVFDIEIHRPQIRPCGKTVVPMVYGRPENTFYPSGYEPLDNLREISREITGPWRIRTTGGRLSHTLVGATTRSLLPDSPALFLDGIFTTDLGPLLQMGSHQIRKIEIHNKEWYYGERYFPGIVAIFTNNESYLDIDLSPDPVRITNHAPRSMVDFVSPDYRDTGGQIPHDRPDLRQTLYWNPDVSPDENIHWHTGDVAGKYEVRVSGRTESGKLVLGQKTITVE